MSDVDLEQLNDMQLDVLKEIGNIGAGNATTALSTMLNVKMDMSVPNVALIQFKDISTIIGSEDQTVVGILLGLEGDIDGMILSQHITLLTALCYRMMMLLMRVQILLIWKCRH